MDAGLAAVCGALAGSVATIGAAFATGWAQREGARISARAEHLRQRREPRHSVYKEFIAAASSFSEICLSFRWAEIEFFTDERVASLQTASDGIKEAWLNVVLAGPTNVGLVASEVRDFAVDFTLSARMFAVAAVIEADGHGVRAPWMGPALIKYKESVAKMPQDIQRFTEIAQAALDNDGSKSLK